MTVKYAKKSETTPDLSPSKMKFDAKLAESLTGLALSKKELKDALRRSRLDLDAKGFAVIPSYRVDILHPVDLAEEVVIGYGLDRMSPIYPPSSDAGQFDPRSSFAERLCLLMAEAGYIETMNYDLLDEPTLYGKFGRSAESRLEVDNPRSAEHYLLRDSLLPSLMAVLGRNTKNEYPQRIFEAGKVFSREGVGIAGDHLPGCALGSFLLFVHRGEEPPRGAGQEAHRRGGGDAAGVPTGRSPRDRCGPGLPERRATWATWARSSQAPWRPSAWTRRSAGSSWTCSGCLRPGIGYKAPSRRELRLPS